MNRLFAAGPRLTSNFRLMAVLCVMASSCHASSHDNNMLNVFYFEHAQVSAVDCAKRGFPTLPIHADWLRTNNVVHQKIVDEIIDELIERGASRREAESSLMATRETYRRQAIEETRLDSALCRVFREYLGNMHTVKGSRYLPTR